MSCFEDLTGPGALDLFCAQLRQDVVRDIVGLSRFTTTDADPYPPEVFRGER